MAEPTREAAGAGDISVVVDAVVNRIASITARSDIGRGTQSLPSPQEIMASLPPSQSAQPAFFRPPPIRDGNFPSQPVQSRDPVCYGCGRSGHIRRDCPVWRRQSTMQRGGPVRPDRPIDLHRGGRYRDSGYGRDQGNRWYNRQREDVTSDRVLSGSNAIRVPDGPKANDAQAVLEYLRGIFNSQASERPHQGSSQGTMEPKN